MIIRPRSISLIALAILLALIGIYHVSYPYRNLLGDSRTALHDDINPPAAAATPPPEGKTVSDQPEIPPKLDPESEELLYDHGREDAAKLAEQEDPALPSAAATDVNIPTSTSKPPQPQKPTPGRPNALTPPDQIDWSQFAYLQYVTSPEHLCNSLMLFSTLQHTHSLATRVLLYPSAWGTPTSQFPALDNATSHLLQSAQSTLNITLKPISLITQKGKEQTWESGFTKLLSWNLTEYSRVIMLDSDGTLFTHLDDLFLLPSTPLAIPRAYWLSPDPLPEKTINKYILSAQILVVEPSTVVFGKLMDEVAKKRVNDYDMEVINWVLAAEALVLPHRRLDLLSGEFRRDRSVVGVGDKGKGKGGWDRYLGQTGERWNATMVLEEARYVHFSDWPRPKVRSGFPSATYLTLLTYL